MRLVIFDARSKIVFGLYNLGLILILETLMGV